MGKLLGSLYRSRALHHGSKCSLVLCAFRPCSEGCWLLTVQGAKSDGLGVARSRGSFAKRLRDAANAMAATEGLAPQELASSTAIQVRLTPAHAAPVPGTASALARVLHAGRTQ